MSDPIMQFFNYEHLKEPMKSVSKQFCELAFGLDRGLPPNQEREVALRKLLEAKDAAVRSVIFVDQEALPNEVATAGA